MKNTRNFWPIGIAIFFIIMVCMIILSVYISIQNKPDDDNAYFSTRQVVDKEINDILSAQAELEKLYSFYVIYDNTKIPLKAQATRKSPPLKLTSPFSLSFSVLDKNNKAIKPNNIKLYITRFAASKDDIDMGSINETSPKIELKKGDWKLMLEFSIDDKKAYFEHHILIGDSNG